MSLYIMNILQKNKLKSDSVNSQYLGLVTVRVIALQRALARTSNRIGRYKVGIFGGPGMKI